MATGNQYDRSRDMGNEQSINTEGREKRNGYGKYNNRNKKLNPKNKSQSTQNHKAGHNNKKAGVNRNKKRNISTKSTKNFAGKGPGSSMAKEKFPDTVSMEEPVDKVKLETVEDVLEDIERIEKEIELEIAEIRSIKL